MILDRQSDLWVHGHVHSQSDYMIGRTRVVCNARGHVEDPSGFDPAFVVSVPDAGGRVA
jgi:Icc-related predicted phosphoesterase